MDSQNRNDTICDNNDPVVYPALILLPDISGFTHYMGASVIAHSQKNVARLLESIIDANELNLVVSEIEGDAILFYQFNNQDSFSDITRQIAKMYLDFHHVLDQIKQTNECECGACSLLQNLSLKFVAHYGDVGSVMVKDYCKLFGVEVITAHRLLKNRIESKDYVLFTKKFMDHYFEESFTSGGNPLEWQNGDITYDFIGRVDFQHVGVTALLKSLGQSRIRK